MGIKHRIVFKTNPIAKDVRTPKYKPRVVQPKKGKGSYNRKRNSNDSEINIKKSIKSQFNLLRICDNERYPAFFKFKNQKYILKIFKV